MPVYACGVSPAAGLITAASPISRCLLWWLCLSSQRSRLPVGRFVIYGFAAQKDRNSLDSRAAGMWQLLRGLFIRSKWFSRRHCQLHNSERHATCIGCSFLQSMSGEWYMRMLQKEDGIQIPHFSLPAAIWKGVGSQYLLLAWKSTAQGGYELVSRLGYGEIARQKMAFVHRFG